MSTQLTVSTSPHVHSEFSTRGIMFTVILALLPAGITSVYFLGLRSLAVIAACILACVLSEFFWQKCVMKTKVTVCDLSAVVTGLLLAYNLPPTMPIWMAVCGSIFAIIVVKQFYGGLGCNIVNPALAARAMMLISWPTAMTTWTVQGISGATPLAAMKAGNAVNLSCWDMIVGNMGGCIGETCSILLILGGAYLIWENVISWRIPVVYIATAAILGALFGHGSVTAEIFTGGLLIGAFFMATDYTTSPMSAKGQYIYAFGCGLLTALIRTWGGYPEGVSFSILIMNVAVPLIDMYTAPRILGAPKSNFFKRVGGK
ncbi:MAG: RnfABCDGE type electron transport complex subunit D [Synergistales bacterium]|nr:RnfABCDGE type electron transport complex subunit D [Synergistales bacterium]MDY6405187.1 RnfABCDGE type electron transport complex subunit D [Synergistales bacterium]MDY6410043.1 RnfABCDGE type electron transport complex subunit D [Synergistales bacterium]MDY6414479.1 RnfABCDGE type electron transport complex subunit D [Synergistales bacterium]MDY6421805.1 RnfABCDGE type electron transport complex subunit D [Synergistales bacterium]